MTLAACSENGDGSPGGGVPKTVRSNLTFTVEGKLDMNNPDVANQSETVTWASFPVNVGELKVAQQQIGQTIGGAVALQLMAFEIYRHDNSEGEEAVKLVNYKSNVQSVLSVISQRYNHSQYAPEEDLYVQPYIVASNLEGATIANRYTPNEPYRLTVYWDDRQSRSPVEEASVYMGGGHLCNVYIVNANYSSAKRYLQVIKNTDEAPFLIYSSSNLYTQCPPIAGTWEYVMK